VDLDVLWSTLDNDLPAVASALRSLVG